MCKSPTLFPMPTCEESLDSYLNSIEFKNPEETSQFLKAIENLVEPRARSPLSLNENVKLVMARLTELVSECDKKSDKFGREARDRIRQKGYNMTGELALIAADELEDKTWEIATRRHADMTTFKKAVRKVEIINAMIAPEHHKKGMT